MNDKIQSLTNKKEIGSRIRSARLARGYGQRELGCLLGLSSNAPVHWEQGRALPTLENISHLSEILGVTVSYILNGEEDATQSNEDKHILKAIMGITLEQRAAVIALVQTMVPQKKD